MADLYAGANEDKLEQKLKKIYGNQELDNKQKIELMVDFYNNELIVDYRRAFENVIHITSEHAINEFMGEYTAEQAKRAEIIMQKYQVLSQEYQSQAKQFQEKHEMVQKDEISKRQGIISNFENHYASIRE
jgi:ferritin-like protein